LLAAMTRIFVGIALAAMVLVGGTAARSDDDLTALSIDQLPPPPAEIAALLEAGVVSFHYGDGWKSSEATAADSSPPASRRMAAETKFQLEYSYSSRTRWHVRRRGGDRRLLIYVDFDSVKIKSSHQVWFRTQPPLSDFWQDRLVQHELDHVRISSNPIVANKFLTLVGDIRVLSERLGATVDVTDDMVDQIVAQHVEKAFEQTVQFVRIRYQELDRVTDHGLVAVPPGSEPSRWLH